MDSCSGFNAPFPAAPGAETADPEIGGITQYPGGAKRGEGVSGVNNNIGEHPFRGVEVFYFKQGDINGAGDMAVSVFLYGTKVQNMILNRILVK